jgi:hypothetical protein
MPDSQPVVAESCAKAKFDKVVKVIPRKGYPAAKIEAAILVKRLKSLKSTGTVFVRHQANVVNAGDSPAMKGPGGIFKGFQHLTCIRRCNGLPHEIDSQFP